jgi:hypothetical protein
MEAEVTSKKEVEKGWLCEYDWKIRNHEAKVVAEGHNT